MADGVVAVGPVKTDRSRRNVDVDPVTLARLRKHRSGQHEQRILVGEGWADHGLAFCAPDGRPWFPDSISSAFTRTVAKHEHLPRVRFHDLRHTHASHLLAAGVDPKIVSTRLGHASVAFTYDTYVHVMPSEQAAAVAAAAALIDG